MISYKISTYTGMKLWLIGLILIVLALTPAVSPALETRTNSYTYDAATGQIKTVDGPRLDVTDITIFDYDPHTGVLEKVTNALGHETLLSDYDASGRVGTITDPNGLVTTLTYYPRGWLKSRTIDGNTTRFTYDAVGQLKTIHFPTGMTLAYTYDAARRLTGISDNLGNTLHYTLDLAGNRIKEETRDSNGALKRVLEREYNQLSQLKLLIGGEGQITRVDYDLNGNPTAQTDPRHMGDDRIVAKTLSPLLTDNTVNLVYDALDRLISHVHLQTAEAINNPGTHVDSDDAVTDYEYNALNQLVKVTDPKGLETSYLYNAFGDLTQLTSPDTGITTFTYDEAGNRITQTDARGITTSYRYDALNRLNTIRYPDTHLNVIYSYDENNNGENGIGRLTTQHDPSGSTRYDYDNRGNIVRVNSTREGMTLATGYAYNADDQLTQLTYPSGRTLTYQYDAAGRIDQVTTTDLNLVTRTVVSEYDYQPFGPVDTYLFGNGLNHTFGYDLDYRQTGQSDDAVIDNTLVYDEANNITAKTNLLDENDSQRFDYDGLSRLTSAQGRYGLLGYSYDLSGNRLDKSDPASSTDYAYHHDSHHIERINQNQIYHYDANGNITDNSIYQFTYGDHNRLTEVSQGLSLATYTYNAQGQRTQKNSRGITHYAYDIYGQLVAETDGNGDTLKEYVYANGQLIALIEPSKTQPPTETIMDNSVASFTGTWLISKHVAGYHGKNYQYHLSQSPGLGIVGTPIDNQQASYTGTWPNATYYTPFYGSNYQYHLGASAVPGTLGAPLDNRQATYVGTWPSSAYVKPYYGSNYQYHAAGTGANTATWKANVSSTAQYDIYMTWSANANRADNTQVTIQHTTGSDTVIVNQQQNGGLWNLLGSYTLDSTSTISVNDDANGTVAVDAISILPAGTPPAIQPEDIARWPLNISTTARYDIYATWNGKANRATDAKYTVHHHDGSETISINQQQNGGLWNLLGTYTLDSNSTVDLSSFANGSVVADGITVLPAGTPLKAIQPATPTATWTANQSGEVQVYARWTAAANRASNAKYTIHHSTGSHTISVNQQLNGGLWNLLGTYTLDSNSRITLSAAADGQYVIADSIRLVSTGTDQPSSQLYYVHNDHLGTPQLITNDQQAVVWQANYDPFGKATITTENITNNIRFPGQYYDNETGLHYNYFRYYDPHTGRYITSDPIGLDGGLNTYVYVGGNPVNFVDPEGLRVMRCSRRLGTPGNSAVSPNQPLRHDFLSVNGEILSFQAGDNMGWSDGWVDTSENEIDDWDGGERCETIREGNSLDKYVLAQRNYAPKYSIVAYPYTTPYMFGARNCQTWVDTVLDRAREAEKNNKNP